MSAGKATPGPWKVGKTEDNVHHVVTLPDGRIAAFCGYVGAHDDAESQANARLIAAAPALLEALKAICDEQDAQQGYATPETYDKARAAIALAGGEG